MQLFKTKKRKQVNALRAQQQQQQEQQHQEQQFQQFQHQQRRPSVYSSSPPTSSHAVTASTTPSPIVDNSNNNIPRRRRRSEGIDRRSVHLASSSNPPHPSYSVTSRQCQSSTQLNILPEPSSLTTTTTTTTGGEDQSKKSKKSIFSRGSPAAKEYSGFLGRKISVKKPRDKSTRQQQQQLLLQQQHRRPYYHQPEQQQQQQQHQHQHQQQQQYLYSSASASETIFPSRSSVALFPEHVVKDNRSLHDSKLQLQQPSDPSIDQRHSLEQHPPEPDYQMPFTPPPRSSSASSRDTHPTNNNNPVQRSNTNPSLLEKYYSNNSSIPENSHRSAGQRPSFFLVHPSTRKSSRSRHSAESPRTTQQHFHSNMSQSNLEADQSRRPSSQPSTGLPSPLPAHNRSNSKQQSPPSLDQARFAQYQGNMASSERVAGLKPPQAESGSQPMQTRESQENNQSSGSQDNASQQNLPQESSRNAPASPPPNKSRDDSENDFRTLLQKHEELQSKYNRVKRLYFDKDAQVQHLQNTVAYQRMAVSRTVLDDTEYASRFGRLEGAIKDLAFSIRKDWVSVPTWLQGYVSPDAHTVGTKEMMAVGRAVISRWLVDEIFHRHFHPALEPNLSLQLKRIEMNLRRQPANTATNEDKENNVAKISNWRRTTFDGLGDALIKEAEEHRSELVSQLVPKLIDCLKRNLRDPAPIEVENGAMMIIENTVGICEKIPLEARDICVEYIMPGEIFNEDYMRAEPGLPPLTNVDPSFGRAPPSEEQEQSHSGHGDETQDKPDADMENNDLPEPSARNPAANNTQRETKKKSIFDNLKKKASNAPQSSEGARRPSVKGSADDSEAQGNPTPPPRIRLSSFLYVEAKGKGSVNELVKAPVYLVE